MVEEGLITETQLKEALDLQAKQGGKVVENLISLGALNWSQFVAFLARRPGVASIDLSNYEIAPDLVSLVPREFAVKHEVFPIDRLGRLLTLGMACPLDSAAIHELEAATGLRVKPLLCDVRDIHRAIKRYYPTPGEGPPVSPTAARDEQAAALEASLKLSHVTELIRRIDSLPALPETVHRVREAMVDPKSSIRDVANIIAMDPPVAAKVLSVANSAAYGFPQRVDDITLAVSLMGLREAYSIVLSVSVIDLFGKSKYFDYKMFWIESLCCAAAARIVANSCGRRTMIGVFCAGLLHDIGRVALSEVAPERYAKVDAKLHGRDLLLAEQQIVGLAHTEAGYELGWHWQLPSDISEAMRFHHTPENATQATELVAIVAVADSMVRTADGDVSENEAFFEENKNTLATLGLDRETAEAMLEVFLTNRDESLRESIF